MTFFLIIFMIAAVCGVVYALIRGLQTFANPDHNSFKTQNSMMFARVKWQALAILIIVIIGFLARR